MTDSLKKKKKKKSNLNQQKNSGPQAAFKYMY